MRVFNSLEIKDEAQVGAARRAVRRFAAPLGFSEDELAELDIVVQEIGTNAARYATTGGCLHWTTPLVDVPGLELFYCDKGPGIYDLDRVVRDGVSTGGSLGGGMGAISRLLDEFEAYSTVRGATQRLVKRRTTHGTALFGRKWVAAARARNSSWEDDTALSRNTGAWSRPRPGEDVNGDAYCLLHHEDSMLLAVVDGLGHGRGAHEASEVALDSLGQWRGEPLDEILHAAHDALRATRGAVMAAIVLDKKREAFYYAGVGNVETRVFGSAEPVRPIPNNGTLGARMSNVRVWPHRWTQGTTIIMASDGLSATWDIGAYPGLLTKSPQLIAGVLLRDFKRDSDDATVLVVR